MDITIIIPCVRYSRFLETKTIPALDAVRGEIPYVIACEPDLNVSECRQKYMNEAETRYVYFMDVDSILTDAEHFEILMDTMEEHQAGSVTATEHWNGQDMRTGKPFVSRGIVYDVGRTIGAGFLYDKTVGAHWDPWLGETYGYIGRELEDVDFGQCIRAQGRTCYMTDKVAFNHAWHEKSDWETDEFAMWRYVAFLISLKWSLPAGVERDSFFRLLHPQPTTLFEKNHSLDGISLNDALRRIYGDVAEYWGVEALLSETSAAEPLVLATPEQRGVEDIWSARYREVKPRSPQ